MRMVSLSTLEKQWRHGRLPRKPQR
jgi:hypothetical protein